MKTALIKFLDYCIGKPLCYFLPIFRNNAGENRGFHNILIIRPGGIGDAVLLYPCLKILKNVVKNAQIDVLAEKRNAGIFRGCKYIDQLYLYDDFRNMDLFRVLMKGYDAVIDTEQWHRLSAVICFLTGAKVRVGFATNERRRLLTKLVFYRQDDHEMISFMNLLSEITGQRHEFDQNESFLDFEVSKNVDFLRYKDKYAAVAGIFSGATVKERRWGVQNYSSVASRLLDKDIGVVLLGGKADIQDSAYFKKFLDGRDCLNLIGKTELDETRNIISGLDVLISADSGLMHVAYGVDTKTVSLFGAGIVKKWAPPGNKNRVINKELFCSPCTKFGYTPGCPYNVQCLKDIDPEEVFNVVESVLSD